MDLLDLLQPEHVVVPLEAPDLRSAIESLVERLERSGTASPSEELHRRIRTEPLRDVVSVSEDAVVPHYRSDAVAELTVALGVSPVPIPTPEPGIDAEPRVVALVLGPQETASLYLQTTATLARLLKQPGAVDALTRQGNADELLSLDRLQALKIQPNLTVRDVMSHRVRSVSPEASVRRVLQLMLRRRLQSVPVVGDKGEVVGLVTESDMMRALLPKIPRAGAEGSTTELEPGDRPIREVMARSVLCVSDDLGISEVASMMINKDVKQIPVVNDGAITGMVSRSDIIRKLFGRG